MYYRVYDEQDECVTEMVMQSDLSSAEETKVANNNINNVPIRNNSSSIPRPLSKVSDILSTVAVNDGMTVEAKAKLFQSFSRKKTVRRTR